MVRAAALYQKGRANQALGRDVEATTSLREELALSAPGNLMYAQQIQLGLAQVYRRSGEMPQLEEAGRQMLAVTLQAGIEVRTGWARMLLGIACYEMNNLEAAMPLFAAVVTEPSFTQNLVLRDCIAGLALAYQAQSLSEQANMIVANHIEFLRRTQRFAELTHAHALRALLALRQGDVNAAARAVEVAAIGPDPGVMEWLVVPRLVQARVLLAGGDKEALRQAMAIADDVADRAAAQHNVRHRSRPMRCVPWSTRPRDTHPRPWMP